MQRTTVRLGLRVAAATTAVGVAMCLAGCIQSTAELPGVTPTATPSASATATPPPRSTATPTPTETASKFSEDCNILLTPAQVYAYNPNFVADSSYKPKAATIPATIAANNGQTCGWLNETSGTVLEVAIATPLPSGLAAARAAAADGTPISSNGENGYFAVHKGIGSAQFFFGSLWLDVSSPDFTAVTDAQAVYPTVIANQQHAGG
jgi:hypothetical protein